MGDSGNREVIVEKHLPNAASELSNVKDTGSDIRGNHFNIKWNVNRPLRFDAWIG